MVGFARRMDVSRGGRIRSTGASCYSFWMYSVARLSARALAIDAHPPVCQKNLTEFPSVLPSFRPLISENRGVAGAVLR